jgi:Sulfatase-modifying factor enzyme 1
VLRGGSWNNNQDNARSANRNRNNPNNRNNNIGFRVVCSSTSFCSFSGKALSSVFAGAPGLREDRYASGIVRRPWFAGRGEEGKMARARPVRTAEQSRPSGA